MLDDRKQSDFDSNGLWLVCWNEGSTGWIREILEPALGYREASRYSSHSCKTTLITWSSMINLFTQSERTLLGHHLSLGSAPTYSRDAQILLQSKVAQMLRMIREGKFCPDESRAARLSSMLKLQPSEPRGSQEALPAEEEQQKSQMQKTSVMLKTCRRSFTKRGPIGARVSGLSFQKVSEIEQSTHIALVA